MPSATNTSSFRPTVLVVGAHGGLGRAVVDAAIARGWSVRALSRSSAQCWPRSACDAPAAAVKHVLGDAMDAASLQDAARGCHFIVHAVNPPRYQRWRELALPMLSNSIAAARTSGARLLMPGNVYNFGPDAGGDVDELSPQNPLTRKGAVRVDMEALLVSAARHTPHPVHSLVVRAGDFFGAHAPASWFGTLMVRPGRPLRRVAYPGPHHVGHAWAYLPDLAEVFTSLMQIDFTRPGKLPVFDVLHFGGHWLPQGVEMAAAVQRAATRSGDPTPIPVGRVPWWLIRGLAPVVPVLREMLEMRYLWNTPLRLNNNKLIAMLGAEPHTPLDEAVEASLQGLGCLSPRAGRLPPSFSKASAVNHPQQFPQHVAPGTQNSEPTRS